jgi:outer membrane protein assembly factor BamB
LQSTFPHALTNGLGSKLSDDIQSAQTRWQVAMVWQGTPLEILPVGALILVGSKAMFEGTKAVVARESETGGRAWEMSLTERVDAWLMTSQGLVIATDDLRLIDPSTGAEIWRRNLVSAASCRALFVSNNTLICNCMFAGILAVDLASGIERWNRTGHCMSMAIEQSPEAGGNRSPKWFSPVFLASVRSQSIS